MPTITIGQNIYQLRKSYNLTQSKLAEKLGVTEQTISKWENDICSPDISILPNIANLFHVSIDRIFGFHLDSYVAEVDKIIKQIDSICDVTDKINFIKNALEKYPNSDKLKLELAWYYYMLFRTDEPTAAEKAISLCCEVIGKSLETETLENAHNMLSQIYTETQQFDKALAELEKISTAKPINRAEIYYQSGNYETLQLHVQQTLWECYLTMHRTVKIMCNTLVDYEKYYELLLKIFSLFDDVGLHSQMHCHLQHALIMKKQGNKSECDNSTNLFLECAEKLKAIPDHHLAKLNDYFSLLPEIEEHMIDAEVDRLVNDMLPKLK